MSGPTLAEKIISGDVVRKELSFVAIQILDVSKFAISAGVARGLYRVCAGKTHLASCVFLYRTLPARVKFPSLGTVRLTVLT